MKRLLASSLITLFILTRCDIPPNNAPESSPAFSLPSSSPNPTETPISKPSETTQDSLDALVRIDALAAAQQEHIAQEPRIKLLELENPLDDSEYWLASVQFEAHHPFLAVYQNHDDGWHAVTQLMPSEENNLPTTIRYVSQTQVDSSRIWIEITGGCFNSGSQFTLLGFDGNQFESVLSHCAGGSAGINGMLYLDSDNTPEAVLDTTDYVTANYLGVPEVMQNIMRWDGEHFVLVSLTRLNGDDQDQVQQLNNRAVDLAEANLWKDAIEIIAQVGPLAPNNEIVQWNLQLIQLTGEQRKVQSDMMIIPFFSLLYYGDYARMVDMFRSSSPEQNFSSQPYILDFTIVGEMVNLVPPDAFEVINVVSQYTNRALEIAGPHQAAVYFVRGWARYRVNPGDQNAFEDLAKAVELAPDEPLFSDSLTYLQSLPGEE